MLEAAQNRAFTLEQLEGFPVLEAMDVQRLNRHVQAVTGPFRQPRRAESAFAERSHQLVRRAGPFDFLACLPRIGHRYSTQVVVRFELGDERPLQRP